MASNERERIRFQVTPMKRMVAVGAVGADFARIWMRSDRVGDVIVTVHPKGKPKLKKEHRIIIHDDTTDLTETVLIQGLEPLKRYRYQVVRLADDVLIGKGQFETFPEKAEDTPDKVSIALMSCHQPFNEDNFNVEPRRMRLFKLVPRILSENDVKFVLLAGDQIYSDHPSRASLFYKHYTERWHIPNRPVITGWDAQTVRRAYQERYRIFWSMKDVKHLYANYPCYPILDDHEIIDDWGAKEVHATRKFLNVRKGAREAYYDYQGSLVKSRSKRLPPSFHYSFEYGNVGIFVLDLRSQRKAGTSGQLFSPAQFKDFEKFLRNNQDKRVLLIMSSVPVVHLPEWLSDVGAAIFGHTVDFPDHWSYKKNRGDRNRFLKLIHRFQVRNPTQRVILLSGDVHIGCAFAIQWQGKGKQPPLCQFTSSAISNLMQKTKTAFSELGPGLAGKIDCKNGRWAKTLLLEPLHPNRHNENPFGGLNIGIVEIHKEEKESPVTLKLVGHGKGKSDRPVDFFVSKRL